VKAIKTLMATYRPLGLPGHPALLLRHADALRFLDDCERFGFTVLGLDFFKVDGRSIVNTQIADFTRSGADASEKKFSLETARNLIRDGLPGGTAVVEFVVSQ